MCEKEGFFGEAFGRFGGNEKTRKREKAGGGGLSDPFCQWVGLNKKEKKEEE